MLNNLIETLYRSLERHRSTFDRVRSALGPVSVKFSALPDEHLTLPLQRTQEKRERRLGLYRETISLIDAGMSHSEAARKLGVGLRTVQRWVSYGIFPERKQRVFPSAADAYGPYLSRRFGEGYRNATQLWREIRDQGFTGSRVQCLASAPKALRSFAGWGPQPQNEKTNSCLTTSCSLADVEGRSLEI